MGGSTERPGGNTAPGVEGGAWTRAFAAGTEDAFAGAFAPDVVLEGPTLNRPVRGREEVALIMGTASRVYESLVFTHEAHHGDRTYVEWEATALGGTVLSGSTVLVRDQEGRIVKAVVQHRPLSGLLAFSAEMGRLLKGQVDDDLFHRPAD
ncbi:nuclear transport factor 2 family protein [Kitasatospora sp. NPDC101235]|uniref:nuclear transport factor 2 family protein n=1 Tax=Kitasatospora sp. NPDC101235 TaxID=3364101 RepID=UPI00381B583B